MPKRLRLIVLALLAAGCGDSPTTPSSNAFPLASGAYRLKITGTGCFVSGSAPATIDIPVTLIAAGANWVVSVPGHSLTGALTSNDLVLTGAIGGDATVDGAQFSTGPLGAARTLAGTAREANRYEGDVIGGSVTFTVAASGGNSSAQCSGATFVLRK